MHTFFILIQYFGLITLFLGTLFILKQKPSKQQNLMLMLYVGTVIDFVGYLFELKATNLNEAMFAIQVSYIGKPVITLAMLLFCLSALCPVSPHERIRQRRLWPAHEATPFTSVRKRDSGQGA